MIETQCKHCNGKFEIEDDKMGKNVECPSCGERFKAAETPEKKYDKAVNNLGIAVGLSVINLILNLAGSEWSFWFSLWCTDILSGFGGIGIAASIILLIVYGVMFFAAKQNRTVFSAAFVMVCLDTLIGGILIVLALKYSENTNDTADLVKIAIFGTIFHCWLLWEMGKGIAAARKMNNNLIID